MKAEAFYSHLVEGTMPPKHPELGPCRLWTGATTKKGYGTVKVGGSTTTAHRYAWILEGGQLEPRQQVDHLCEVRHCTRKTHLEPVTARVNLLRGNTITSAKAAQTECIHGHLFDKANTRIRSNGTRACRACNGGQRYAA